MEVNNKLLSTRIKLALTTGLFVGCLYMYNHQFDNLTTIPANDYVAPHINNEEFINRDITVDDVRYKIYSSPNLTSEEKEYLFNEDFFTNILPYINSNEEFKIEFLERITDLDIRSINDPLVNSLVDDLNTEETITTGLYNPYGYKNIIFVDDYEDIKHSTVAHEFVHLCEPGYDYSFFTESAANMCAHEYFGQIIPDSNAYIDEVLFTKVLMETIGIEPIKQYVFGGDFSLINERLKSNLSDVEYQKIIYWFQYSLSDDSEKRDTELLDILDSLHTNIYGESFANDEVIEWVIHDFINHSFCLQRPYFNQHVGDSYVIRYTDDGTEYKIEYPSIDEREKIFEGVTK